MESRGQHLPVSLPPFGGTCQQKPISQPRMKETKMKVGLKVKMNVLQIHSCPEWWLGLKKELPDM